MEQIDKEASNGLPSFNADEFRASTERNVVYATYKKSKNFCYDNPDPYGYFPGRKGDSKLYRIRWRSDLTEYTNCYAFACGWTVKGKVFDEIYQPGFLSGKDPHTKNEYVAAIIADLKAVGREVYEVYDVNTCPKNLPKADKDSYWIKILFIGDDHFHMMRKDEMSGKWIHKAGWKQRPKVHLKTKEGKDGKLETKYETKDKAGYMTYNASCRHFVEYQFAFALRIQR